MQVTLKPLALVSRASETKFNGKVAANSKQIFLEIEQIKILENFNYALKIQNLKYPKYQYLLKSN